MANKSDNAQDFISKPQGGGALSGIGEKFSPDLHTGTGNFSVPISLPKGRNGFQPEIGLMYSTGNGNSEFGLGWTLSVPGISRKTSEGIPVYNNAFNKNRKDVFILSGAEDLVPVEEGNDFTRYQPRSEGVFAKIIHRKKSNADYWEVNTKDGITNYYGSAFSSVNDNSVIANPDNKAQIFSWGLSQTKDAFGNLIEYEYDTHHNKQGDPYTWCQRYLREIRYVDYEKNGKKYFLVKVKFSYDEDRPDAYSNFKSGFEIRTEWRCSKIEVYVQPDPAVNPILSKRYELIYIDKELEACESEILVVDAELANDPQNIKLLVQKENLKQVHELLRTSIPVNATSLLSQIRVSGFDEKGNSELLPPIQFGYTKFEPLKRKFQPIKGSDLPSFSLSSPNIELVDVTGNGLPDLIEINQTIRVWRNLGNGRFDIPQTMRQGPLGLKLSDVGVQLIDADGDGRVDLLINQSSISGYYSLQHQGFWNEKSFQKYRHVPSFTLRDPEVKLLDLDGDGITDVIRSGSRMECFFNDRNDGWVKTRYVERKQLVEFPNINFSDPRVKWGDMSGDGMQDIILVYDGNVEFWPNKGYGNWGRRRHMSNSPRFPFNYDPKRILIGDIDGDGLSDLVYVDNEKITIWINQAGNSWSSPIMIKGTPPISGEDDVRLVDLLGIGTSGLIWSSNARLDQRPRIHFLDFTGTVKPYLLNRMVNNMGAETTVEYKPSTHYYLKDEQRINTRWKTSLPFPVQVVSKVEIVDYFSKGKLVTLYEYHHGYWDGKEREFRGFGRVDQYDTESFEVYNQTGLSVFPFSGVDGTNFCPPTLLKTWFHQGAIDMGNNQHEEIDYSNEYWIKDKVLLTNSNWKPFPAGLSHSEKRDALRTKKGKPIRTELFMLDGSDLENNPVTVTENNYGVRKEDIQGEKKDDRKIFFSFPSAQRSTQWERGNDPMHAFTFFPEYDAFGQNTLQIHVACSRGWTDINQQGGYVASRTRMDYASSKTHYIVDKVSKIVSLEITDTSTESLISLSSKKDNQLTSETISCTLNFYDEDQTTSPGLGEVKSFGALTRTETLVFNSLLLKELYKNGTTSVIPPYLNPQGTVWNNDYPLGFRNGIKSFAGYKYQPGGQGSEYPEGFYAISVQKKYDFFQGKGCGLVVEQKDPLDHPTVIEYDQYNLFPVKVTSSSRLVTKAEYHYVHMQAEKVIDANGNEVLFVFNPLGLLKETWNKGNPSKNEGDQNRPSIKMEYGFNAFYNSDPVKRQPVYARTIQHVYHDSDTNIPAGKQNTIITKIEYTDGLGRLLQTRTQAESLYFGDAVFSNSGLPFSQLQNAPAIGIELPVAQPQRVLVSGWQVYNNKGKVVEKYEPFFDQGWSFIAPDQNQNGEKSLLFYDAREQLVKTLNPDGSVQQVIHGIPNDISDPPSSQVDTAKFKPTPWEAYTYDLNDNAGRTHQGSADAQKYLHHWNTPVSIEVDALGKVKKTVIRNRAKPLNVNDPLPALEEYVTLTKYDIRGNLVETRDALGRLAFTYGYDLANRPIKVFNIDAGTQFSVLDSAGKLIEYRDNKGALTLNLNDDLGRLTKVWARDNNNSSLTLREHIIFGDELPQNMNASQNNLLGQPALNYDEAGLLIFDQYDFKGNLLQKSRQLISNQELMSVYNSGNWNIESFIVDWTPGSEPTLDTNVFTTTFSYDALNRLKSLLYPADINGTRTIAEPLYNQRGDLESINVDGSVYVQRIAYNAKGQRVLIAYGNGVMTRYLYHPKNFRLLRLRTERYNNPTAYQYNPSGNVLQDYLYDYDLIGNVISVHENVPGCGVAGSQDGSDELNRNFEYDPLYRLVQATGRCAATVDLKKGWEDGLQPGFNSWNHGTPNQDNAPALTVLYKENFRYDAADNILQHSNLRGQSNAVRNYSLVQNHNQLNTINIDANTIYTYGYDSCGNMISENTERKYQWNYENRMKSFSIQTGNAEPTIHAQYLYNNEGYRVKKLVRKQGGDVFITINVDGLFELHQSIKSGVTDEVNYIHIMDDQTRIAQIRIGNSLDPNDTSPAIQYHLCDHLGSSRTVLNTNGTKINREEYFAFGETSFGSFKYKRYRYTGRERDEESGLNNHRARYYAPWILRWTSCDPKGGIDGANLYAYTSNNPVKLIDPEGTDGNDPPTSQTPLPPLKQFDESKYTVFDRNKRFGPAEQAEKNYNSLSPQKKMLTDRQTAPLKKAAERESFRLATPWQEQVIFDVSEYTGGNDMARAWTGASEWNEEYTTWERVGFGVRGIATAASYATPVAELAEGFQTVRVGIFSRVPVQLRGPAIGPAFRTAEAAAGQGNHYLRVAILNPRGKVIAEWFEASETGLGLLGHTEQKALMRMNLKPGQTVVFAGEYNPCNRTGGCHMTMSSVAKESGADIIYESVNNDQVRHYFGGIGHIKKK